MFDISTSWYLDIAGSAVTAPGWLRVFFAVGTDGFLLVLLALMALTCWRAWRGDARARAVAWLGPAGLVIAYPVSELIKIAVAEDRPCRNLVVLAECPPVGDFSFPSNHSTIAAAMAAAVALGWPRLTAVAFTLALLAGFSRVFVGAHYPHDVLTGLVLGAAVVLVVVSGLTSRAERLIEQRIPPVRPARR